MGTIVTGIIVAGIVALAVRSMIKDKKKRKVDPLRRRLQTLRRTLPLDKKLSFRGGQYEPEYDR